MKKIGTIRIDGSLLTWKYSIVIQLMMRQLFVKIIIVYCKSRDGSKVEFLLKAAMSCFIEMSWHFRVERVASGCEMWRLKKELTTDVLAGEKKENLFFLLLLLLLRPLHFLSPHQTRLWATFSLAGRLLNYPHDFILFSFSSLSWA